MTIKRLRIYMMAGGIFCLSSVYANPAVSDVVARQRWPWDRKIDIDFALACDVNQEADVTVAAYKGDAPVDLPDIAVEGNRYNLPEGTHRIVIDPMKTACTNSGGWSDMRFEVTAMPSPLYMILDLTNAVGTAPAVEFVCEADLITNKWGAWERDFVNGVESLIWTAVTNDAAYMTDRLVLRRVLPGTFDMSYGAYRHSVTLTKPFYVGVFEVTQKQWLNVTGSAPPVSRGDTYPAESVSHDMIRGATLGANWPASSAVDDDSFMGKLRDKSQIGTFDLPTEAQWEYACRAGTATYYNDNETGVVITKTGSEEIDNNGNTNRYLNVLGCYKFNGGGPKTVGSFRPNAWGLYDMHGNQIEVCLDRYAAVSTDPAIDPKGPETGADRVRKSGSRDHGADSCTSQWRANIAVSSTGGWMGFRLAIPMP